MAAMDVNWQPAFEKAAVPSAFRRWQTAKDCAMKKRGGLPLPPVQQMRGSWAPSSMPSRRSPPMGVCSTTCPGLPSVTLPMRTASLP